jgi:RNA polymerase sigma-70 factor, ECF subfamily
MLSPKSPVAPALSDRPPLQVSAPPTTQPEARDFRALVLPLSGALLSRAFFLERSRGEAWDLVQDTLERALRGFHQFRPGSNVRRWLFRIMHNLFIDRYRRRAHEQRTMPIDDFDLAAPEPEAAPPWEAMGDLDLKTLLGGLDRPFRQVLELHFLEKLSYQDISRSLHIPAATVGTRLLRARNKLRVLMAPRTDVEPRPIRTLRRAPAPVQRLRGRGIA